ncbi:MAG TPA: hypothetical protein VID47_02500, partial [Actinomycetota bacterium]
MSEERDRDGREGAVAPPPMPASRHQAGSRHVDDGRVDPAPAYEDLLPLIGDRTFLVHPRSAEAEGGGGDVDLLVEHLDANWPLRLPSGWRLLQMLQYDVKGWYWVLERGGQTLAIDTVDDPRGLGRDGIPTDGLIELAERHPQAARAAYLTLKRIRKGIRREGDWRRISSWAATDPVAYRRALEWSLGGRVAARLTEGRDGVVPPDGLMEWARALLWLRRRSSPARMAASFGASMGRWYRRVLLPTGVYVIVVGPDGSGKSTLAEALPDLCAGPGGPFRRWTHLHWRPGLLPRAGGLVGSPLADPTKPHGQTPHGTVGSLASVAYHWLDFFLGGWVRLTPVKVRSGLILLERGWWDVAVDPRRYRIAGFRRLVLFLGGFLMQPDLVLVLEAPSAALLSRKAEVGAEELERQTRAWHSTLPERVPRVYVDASQPEEAVRRASREAVFSLLAKRASRRYGIGWTGFPSTSSPRWLLPRGPAAAARSALRIYRPMTLSGMIGWEVARVVATTGLLRASPRADGPSEEVRALLAPYLPPRATLAIFRTNHPKRCVAMIVASDGRPLGVAKIALDDASDAALSREHHNLETLGPYLSAPVRAPRVLDRAPGILLLETVSWRPRARPAILPQEVAFGLGRAFAASSSQGNEGM